MQPTHDDTRLELCFQSCSARAWRLAYGFLGNPADASDAVQQAFVVAAGKRDRIPADDPWPWFSVVVSHEARNMRRRRRPLTNHGPVPGSAGDLSPVGFGEDVADEGAMPPGAAMERAETAREVWAALNSLPERERDALVLVHISGLTHETAAEALDIPRKTLTAHVARGMERMRGRLRLSEVSLLGAIGAVPVAQPPGGWDSALAAWHAAQSGAAAGGATGTGVAGAIVGGTIMASKAALVASVVVAFGLGVGGAVLVPKLMSEKDGAGKAAGKGTAAADAGAQKSAVTGSGAADEAKVKTPAPSPAVKMTETPAGDASAGTPAGGPTAAAQAAPGEAALVKEAEQLRAKLAVAESARAELTAKLKPFLDEAAEKAPAFTFGAFGKHDAVQKSDWKEIGEASKIVSDIIAKRAELREQGKPAPANMAIELQRNTERVRKYEYVTQGVLPTAAEQNGQLTHPITMANMLAAELRQGGEPFTEAQSADITAFGEGYESDWKRAQSLYGTDTIRPKKILDEYTLKQEFYDKVWKLLTDRQRELIVPAKYRNVAGIDLYSPTLMLIHTSPVLAGTDKDEIKAKLIKSVSDTYRLGEEFADRLKPLADIFMQDVAPALDPVPDGRARNYTFEQGAVAGQATLKLLAGVLALVDLPKSAREAVMDESGFFIPRLVVKAAGRG